MLLARRLAGAALMAVLAAGCGGGASSSRPSSNATLSIVSPVPNQVTGPNLTIQLNLVGATVVPATVTSGALRGDQGHVHVMVDQQLVSMAFKTTQDLNGLTPGTHSLQAEFVAIDHKPFAHRIIAAPVLFVVK